jgi:hypothetical protein
VPNETAIELLSSNTIDLSAGSFFQKIINADTTLAVSNVPTYGSAGSFVLELTNAGAWTITWWSGNITWAGGSLPTFTSGTDGTDIVWFYTLDGGTTWRGIVLGLGFTNATTAALTSLTAFGFPGTATALSDLLSAGLGGAGDAGAPTTSTS